MAKSRFSREEMLQILKEDKILGEDVSQLVDMSFIKNPEKNPELIMDCYILALGQLGYSAENIHQVPASAMMNDKIHLQLHDSKHWAHVWILKHIRHFFNRIGITEFANDERLCFGDLICPRSRRFISILGQLLNFIIFKSELDPQIADVDNKCRDIRDELDAKERKRVETEQKIQSQRPYQQKILADIDNLKSDIHAANDKHESEKKKYQLSIDKKKKVQAEAEEIQDQIGIITAEIKMLTEEKSRLAELVVTNPDEWESNFQKMKSEIVETNETISWLKDEIPRIQSSLRSIQKYGQNLSNLLNKLEEVKSSRLEKSEIEKAQNSTQTSIQNEQKELDKLEMDLKLLQQSHQMEIDKANKKIESLKENLESKEAENKEISDLIRGIKSELKKISAEIETEEAIKNDIDYHKPKIERRAKAYADEVEKLNEDCKKSVEKAQRQFVNILS